MGVNRPSPVGPASNSIGMATAEAFDAKIAIGPTGGNSLFFVIGRDGPPDPIIRSVGGRVVTRFPDSRRVLAFAPMAAHSAMQGHPGLNLAGPVSVDPERFQSFTNLIGLRESRGDIADA